MFLCKKEMLLRYIEIPVTVRCTLNCKHCANLMQYYPKEQQKDIDIENLISNIQKFLDNIDYILKVRLIGGEPFLYQNLLTIIELLEKSEKVQEINIVTNGTIVPSDYFFEQVKNKSVTVSISNYGELSRKMEILTEKLKQNDISFEVAEELLTWMDYGKVEYCERTNEEYQSQYKTCRAGCRTFLNGKIHICPRSSHGMDIGIIPDVPSDYVNVLESGLTKKEFKEKLIQLEKRNFIEACKYCQKGLVDCQSVPAAIQQKRNE